MGTDTSPLPLFFSFSLTRFFRDVHEAFLVETETLKPETEALTIQAKARPRPRPSELETETRPRRTNCAS